MNKLELIGCKSNELIDKRYQYPIQISSASLWLPWKINDFELSRGMDSILKKNARLNKVTKEPTKKNQKGIRNDFKTNKQNNSVKE